MSMTLENQVDQVHCQQLIYVVELYFNDAQLIKYFLNLCILNSIMSMTVANTENHVNQAYGQQLIIK